jgi:hypothetical protein
MFTLFRGVSTNLAQFQPKIVMHFDHVVVPFVSPFAPPILDCTHSLIIYLSLSLTPFSLQEYLEEFNELEVISQQTQQEHPEEEASTPNFAQAALLLHQSSNVYSRKVEYLYTLVYAALNSLVNSSANSKNGKSPSKKRVDAEIAEFDDFDQQVNFLLLDDVMPTDEDGVKINLASAKNGNHAGLNLDASLFNATTTRLSLGGLTRADQTSTASQYHHQQAAILSTLVGSDAGLGILQNTGSQNGIFYMRGTASQQAAAPQQQERRASSFGGGNILNLSGAASSPMQQHDDGDGGGFYDGGGDDDDHMEGPGFQLAAEDDAPMDGGAQPPPPVMQQVKKAKNDPWHLLDPHDAETTKVRSLRMGSTFVLPAGLDPLGTTKASSKQRHHAEVVVESVAEPVCIATAAFKATMANEQRRRERLSISGEASNISDTSAISTPAIEPVIVVPMKGLAFGDEFAYIAKANNKRKAAAQRERRKLLLVKPSAVPQQEADQLMGYDDHYGGDDDDNSFGGDDDDGAGFQAFDDGNQYEAAENGKSLCCSLWALGLLMTMILSNLIISLYRHFKS